MATVNLKDVPTLEQFIQLFENHDVSSLKSLQTEGAPGTTTRYLVLLKIEPDSLPEGVAERIKPFLIAEEDIPVCDPLA